MLTQRNHTIWDLTGEEFESLDNDWDNKSYHIDETYDDIDDPYNIL